MASQAIVQLIQINQPFLQRQYLPYTSGLLQAYVTRHARNPGHYLFLEPLFERLPIADSLSACSMADIFGFSCYIWNFRYSLELAKQIRQHKPHALILFGGPQVPDDQELARAFLEAYPFIDVLCHGQGEVVFLQLLEAWPGRQWQSIAGISYRDQQGPFRHQPPADRIQDLEQIPSPYLMNLFEPLLRRKSGPHWVALWETNRGCPFSCSFCDWGSAIASKVRRFGEQRLNAEIEWFARHQIHLVYCCDANYGILQRDLELTQAMVAARQTHDYPKQFYIQNTKNVTERAFQIQSLISQSGLNQAVTLSLQSVNPEVLKHIRRDNISLDAYRELQHRFRQAGVMTYTDLLIGLPGETLQSFAQGLQQVINEGQHHLVRFYNVALLPNAEMAASDYRKAHGIETVWIQHTEPMAALQSDILEFQEIVIATASLNRQDWRKVRELAWWAEFLYFNRKLLQVPIVILHCAGLSYSQFFEFLLTNRGPRGNFWLNISRFLQHKALELQQGQPEMCLAELPGRGQRWLSVEDYLFMGLSQSGGWSAFFQEARQLFDFILAEHNLSLPPHVLDDAFAISWHFLQTVLHEPHAQSGFRFAVKSNCWQVYQAVLKGEDWHWQAWQGELMRDWKGPPFDVLKVLN